MGDVKGLSRQLLCPRCWVLCRLADSVSLRKCKVPISHCTGTQSQVQPYSLQGRCPKWDFQPMQLQVLTASLRPSASGHLWKSLQWLAESLLIFTYVGWGVQLFPFFFFWQIISTQLIITLNVVVVIFTISLTIHPGSPRWSHKEGFCLTLQITNLRRGWVLLQLHIAHTSVPLQNTIHVT